MAQFIVTHRNPDNPIPVHLLPDGHPAKAEEPRPYYQTEIEASTPQEAVTRLHTEVLPGLDKDDPKRAHTFVELVQGPPPVDEAKIRADERAKAKADLKAEILAELRNQQGGLGAPEPEAQADIGPGFDEPPEVEKLRDEAAPAPPSKPARKR